jgi:hypothetical protein
MRFRPIASYPVNQANTYFLEITDNNNNCAALDSIFITDNSAAPQIMVSDTSATLGCDPASISFTASSNINSAEYSWQNNMGTILSDTDSLTVNMPGDYQLIVTDSLNGCADSIMLEVLENIDAPEISISGDTVLSCADESLFISGSSPVNTVTFEWVDQQGVLLSDSSILEVDSVGLYELLATDTTNGCTSSLTQAISASIQAPQISIANGLSDTVNCIPGSVLLEGVSSSNVEVQWQNSQGDSLANTNTLVVDSAGTFTFYAIDTISGCDTSVQITVIEDTEAPMFSIEIPDTLDCDTDAITLIANSPIGTSCMWDSNISNCEYPVTTAGTYFITVTDLSNGCTRTDSVEVLADYATPDINVSENMGVLGCTDNDFLFVGSSISDNVQMEWQNSDGDVISQSNDLLTDIIGTYLFIVLDTLNGCSDSIEVQLTENLDAPPVEITGDTMLTCSDTVLLLSVNNPIDSISYEWLNEQGMLLSDSTILDVSTAGIYQLTAIDTTNDCQSSLTQEVITSTPAPLISIANGVSDTINCIPGSVLLEGVSGSNVEVQWQNNLGDSLSNINTLVVDSAGVFTFYAIDTISGCDTSLQVTIVEDTEAPSFSIEMTGFLNCENDTTTLIANSPLALAACGKATMITTAQLL